MAKAVIDLDKCRGCGCCLRACPGGHIVFGRKVEVGPGCCGCGACADDCPFEAIRIKTKE